jgi:hypothetical protein
MQIVRTPCARAALIAVFLAAPLAARAQNSEIRDLTGFDAVVTSNGIDVNVTQGDRFRVEVVAPSASLASVLTELEDETLVIRLDRKRSVGFGWFGSATVNVTMPIVHGLSASGGADLRSTDPLTGDSLVVSAAGGSDVSLEVVFDALEATASGGSDVRLTGKVGTLRTQASGGSDLDAHQLTANNAAIGSSGGSDTSITVLDSLTVTASGGSDVVYSGEPKSVSVNASGGSDIRSRNEGESALTSGLRNLFGN